MTNKNLNEYIKTKHIRALEKFNEELQIWTKETGEEEATLYEDANTSFTLSDLKLCDGNLYYRYDGKIEKENVVCYDDEEKTYYEKEGMDSIMDCLKFWRLCLRRAKRYWSMDSDRLDAIQNGDIEDSEDEELEKTIK